MKHLSAILLLAASAAPAWAGTPQATQSGSQGSDSVPQARVSVPASDPMRAERGPNAPANSPADIPSPQTAIPSATMPAVRDPAALPRTQHYIGLAVENIPPQFAKQLKLQKNQGLMVLSVLNNSPAQAAKLKAEDLLIEVNGKPVTSQEDLARAANEFESDGKGDVHIRTARLTYLRDGDKFSADVTPAPRPAPLLVQNPGRNFLPNFGAKDDGQGVLNIVLPNGNPAQVGTGYRIALDKSGSAVDTAIREGLAAGKPIVLTQDTDPVSGTVKNSITYGAKTYEVTKDNLTSLPQALRPLADQLVNAPVPVAKPPTQMRMEPVPAGPDKAVDERIRKLEESNEALRKKIDELIQALQAPKK